MSIKIGTNQDGFTTYENQPEQAKTLSKNEKPLTVEDVENIVLSVLSSVGIVITDEAVKISKSLLVQNDSEAETYLPVLLSDGVEITESAVTISKSLLVQNELETDKYLPVLLSDTGIHRINLFSAFPGALVVRGNFGTDTTADKLVDVRNPS